jgi:anaerobic C4-dicarboxylate transporter
MAVLVARYCILSYYSTVSTKMRVTLKKGFVKMSNYPIYNLKKQKELEKRIEYLEMLQKGLTEDEAKSILQAKSVVDKQKVKREFLIHLIVYLVVNNALWAFFFITTDGFPVWMIFVTVGWGIGLLGHFIDSTKR